MSSSRRVVVFAAAALLGAAALYFTRSPSAPVTPPPASAAQAPLRPSESAEKSIDKALDNFGKSRPPVPPPPSLTDK
jgi:hypothetical protein